MAFVNEIPTAEDIEKYDLPYNLDLERPIEQRRSWLADRERGFYLTGPGVTGNQAFEDNVKMYFNLILGRSMFKVVMEPKQTPGDFNSNPYHIHWPALLEIWTVHPQESRMVEVCKTAREAPNVPHPLLQDHSLNEFVKILKEAITAHKEGDYNKYIQAPITVSFGF